MFDFAIDWHHAAPAGPGGQAKEPVIHIVWTVHANDVRLFEADLGQPTGDAADGLAHVAVIFNSPVGNILDPQLVGRFLVNLLHQIFEKRQPVGGRE